MRIILQGADFSANNIGKVTVVTEKAAAYSTLMGLTGTKKTAIEEFISNAETAGYLSKITRLYIPGATTDLTKMFANIVTQNFTVDVNPSSSKFAAGQTGGIYNTGLDTALEIPIQADQLTGDSFHVLQGYIDNGVDATDSDVIKYRVPPFNWSTTNGVRMNYTRNTGGIIPEGRVAGRQFNSSPADVWGFQTDAQASVSIKNSSGKLVGAVGFNINGTSAVLGNGNELTSQSGYTQAYVTEKVMINGYANDMNYMLNPLCVFSCGKGFTKAEFLAYKALMDKLIADLGGAAVPSN